MTYNPPPNMPPPPPPGAYGAPMPGRIPSQVNVASILLFISGGFAILGGLILLLLGSLAAIFAVVGVLVIILGGLEIWVGVALRQLKEWARMAAIIIAGIAAVLNLISVIKGSYTSVIGLVLDLVIIYMLTQRPVVEAFERSKQLRAP